MLVPLIYLILFYFSYKQSKKLLKEPNRINSNICLILGGINLIFFLQAFVVLFIKDDESYAGSIKLISLVLAAIFGFFAYINFSAVFKVKQNTMHYQSANNLSAQCENHFNDTNKSYTSYGSVPPRQSLSANSQIRFDNNSLGFWISLASPIATVIIIFQKWIVLPFMEYAEDVFSFFTGSSRQVQKEFSLFEISDVLSEINRYISSDDMELLANIIKISAIIVIIVQVICLYALLTNKESIKKFFLISAVITSLVSICFLILINRINSYVAENSYDIISNLIESTAMPYFAIIISFIGGVSAQKLIKYNNLPNPLNIKENRISGT